MSFRRPLHRGAGAARSAPPSDRSQSRGTATRFGAPPLVALGSALALLALLCCALLVPGFVRPAGAETTTSTQTTPADTSPDTTSPPDTLPADPAPTEPANGRELATLTWGDGAGQVGLARPTEGLARGPEALAVAPCGKLAILDSVNSRVVMLTADGSFMDTVDLPISEPRFLAVDDAAIHVLDADADRRLVSFDWQGVMIGSALIPALDDVVTGFFATADGLCIEVAHEDVFLVDFRAGAGVGARDSRPEKAELRPTVGRPVDNDLGKAVKVTFKPRDGMKLKRFKVDKKSLESTQTQILTPRLGDKAVEHLVSVDGDGAGGLIVGARLLLSKGDPRDMPVLIVGRLAGGDTGSAPALTDTVTLADSPFAYLGQPYVVAPDGRILQPVGSDQGYTIFVFSLPGAAVAGGEEVGS